MAGDAVVAGRLEIPVQSDTSGFKQRLKAAVEKAAEGVTARVGVTINDKGLRDDLEAAVKTAAKGVKATVGVDVKVDQKDLAAKLQAAVTKAGPVKVSASVEGLSGELDKQIKAAQAKAGRITVQTDAAGGPGLLAYVAKYTGLARIMGQRSSVTVPTASAPQAPLPAAAPAPPPVPAPQPAPPARGGSFFGGGGQGRQQGGQGGTPQWLRPRGNARSSFTPVMMLGLASVIQPAIAAIGGSLGGLSVMAATASKSLGVLAGSGGVLAALGANLAVIKIAAGSLSGEMSKLPKPLQDVRRELEKQKKPWDAMKQSVGVSFWKELRGQIEPAAKVVIPLLSDGLGLVAREMGEAGRQTAQWMATPLFRGQATAVFGTLGTLTDGFGKALLGAAQGMVNITQAAGPMLAKFSGVMSNFGSWMSGIGETSAERNDLALFFDYAWQKAAQLWDMIKNLGGALKATFAAGQGAGDSLLDTLQRVIREWREWAQSPDGAARIQAWFEAIKPITEAAGRLLLELGRALARLSEDSSVAILLDQITTELLPALETFLRVIGSTLGPAVITFLSNLMTVISQMSAAGSPLGQFLDVISSGLAALSRVFTAHPDFARNVGVLLGALLGFRALLFFSSILPGLKGLSDFIRGGGRSAWIGAALGLSLFSGGLSDLHPALQGAIAGLAGLLTFLPGIRNFGQSGKGLGTMATHVTNLGNAFTTAQKKASGFSGAMHGAVGALGYGAGAVGGGLRGAASGLVSVLGGPWGIALMGATAAIGGFVAAQENAAAAAKSFSETLDEQTGALTDASTKWMKDSLTTNFSVDDWKLIEERTGLTMAAVVQGLSAGGDASRKFTTDFDALQERMRAGDFGYEVATRAQELGNSIQHLRNDMESGADMWSIYSGSMTGVTSGAVGIAGAVNDIASAMAGALPAAESLLAAYERIAGIHLSAREAQRRLNESTTNLSKVIAENGKVVDSTGKSLKGKREAADQAGAALDGYARQAWVSIEADYRQGKGLDHARTKMDQARAAFVKGAEGMGYSTKAANVLADQVGLTTGRVNEMGRSIKGLPTEKSVTLKAREFVTNAVRAAAGAMSGLRDKTVTLTMIYRSIGASAANAFQAARSVARTMFQADGGVVSFADGGVRGRVRSFADGAEDHIAQIANAGDWRVWAEPETGGEAYIPLGSSKRARSMQILKQVADRFGMALMPVAAAFQSAMPRAALAPAGSAVPLSPAGGSSRGATVTFEPGAITVNNPAPEPASRSIATQLREVGSFGLFGRDDEE